MHIAILTFEGFNELDSLVALGILTKIKKPNWRVTLCCPTSSVTSMNGVTVHAQSTLAEAGLANDSLRENDSVTLINGESLIDMLLKYKLGFSEKHLRLYEFKPPIEFCDIQA